ncbi:MAG: hypothetical protein WD058_00645 [Dehalococcoidia bacterium]
MTTMQREDVMTRHRMAATAYEKAFDRFFARWTDLNQSRSRLQGWRTVGFVNTDGADVAPRGSAVIDGRAWPDATEMATLIRAVRQAEEEYRSAWDALSSDVRAQTPLRIN